MYILTLMMPFFIFAKPVVLYPWHSTSIAAQSGSVTIDKKGIVSVKDFGSRLLVVGKKSGTATLRSGKETHSFIVLNESTYKTYLKLENWLRDKKGPQLIIENQKIYVRGEFLTYLDWLDLNQFTNEGDDFTIQASIDPAGKEKINDYLKKISEKNNLPFSDLNTLPNWEISIANAHKNNTPVYKKIFSPYGIKINNSSYALSNIPMIEVAIFATEIKKNEMTQLGIQWPSATPFQILPSFKLNPDSLSLSLDHLEQNGIGRVLASPTLLTQSGEEATFHSGGEIPIKTSNQFNANVVWKKYGIQLKIKPLADFTGKMDIQIDCEVSMIDNSQTIDGVPGLLINKISSRFNLKESKTIALSGLLKEEWGNSRQGLPGLTQIPLFGQLFSSENYRNNKSELVFFVTPKIIH